MNTFSFRRMMSVFRAILSVRLWFCLAASLGFVIVAGYMSASSNHVFRDADGQMGSFVWNFYMFVMASSLAGAGGGRSKIVFTLPATMAEKFVAFVSLCLFMTGLFVLGGVGICSLMSLFGVSDVEILIGWQLFLVLSAMIPLLAVLAHYVASYVLVLIIFLLMCISLYVVYPFYFTFCGYDVEVGWIMGEWGKSAAAIAASAALYHLTYRLYRVLPASGSYVSFFRL